MAATNPGSPRTASHLRVLVVDDNMDGADALCALLATMGCTTAAAYGGADGLAVAAAFDPQLAFIDLEMPDMSGCDVVRQLRSSDLPGAAWCVCLTGRSHADDRRLCFSAGFDDFFTKPMPPQRLEELIAATLAARSRQ